MQLRRNIGTLKNSQIMQKQLGYMESEVKEIQIELASMWRSRYDTSKNISIIHDLELDTVVKDNKQVDNSIHKMYEAKYNEDVEESRKSTDENVVLKTQVQDMKQEMEELKVTVDEKNALLQEYRMKYLQAQQQAKEMKRQLDVTESNNKQASDQIQIEMQNMKMKFEEKLQELAPLPDLLKGAQIQIQEADELQQLTEDHACQINYELYLVKEKLVDAENNLTQEKKETTKLTQVNNIQKNALDAKNRELEELYKEIDDYKWQSLVLEEKLSQLETKYAEKETEYSQLVKDHEELKRENNKMLNRAMERSKLIRNYLQSRIVRVERQMAMCRALCTSYQKDREQLRQRIQMRMRTLKEQFKMVYGRLRGLQRYVAVMKSYYRTPPETEDEIIDVEN